MLFMGVLENQLNPGIKDIRVTQHTIDLGDTKALQDIEIFQSRRWRENTQPRGNKQTNPSLIAGESEAPTQGISLIVGEGETRT
jgi:hypothetical protein